MMGRRPLGIVPMENRLSTGSSEGEEKSGAELKATAEPSPTDMASAGMCDAWRLTC
jgi:hypothetical protein